jgi:glycosidase
MSTILKNGILSILICLTVLRAQAQPDSKRNNNNEVIYHLFLRSFYDSNEDRHGDFNGLRQKLDYLQDLGVTAILLLPLYDADCYHNYFANDFEKIDPKFGTFDEYIAFVKDAHKRNMKVYMDMETQYVTSKHKWYKDAVGNLSSPYSNYLLFDDAAHTAPATMVFGLRELTSYDGKVIPITTVNLKSNEVLDYNIGLFKHFMDPNKDGKFDDGVDGFRLDHTMDNLDNKPTLTNLFTEFWYPLIKEIKKLNPTVSIVAEQADWKDYGYKYFEKAGVDRMFGFGLQRAILSFDKQQLIKQADSVLVKIPKGTNQIIFIENHDLDRFASLETTILKQKLAASLQLLIGGIPSIYYGQEIGMKGKGGNGAYGISDGNDIPRREAFEWYKTRTGNGMELWYKETGKWWTETNLKENDGISFEEQKDNPASLYNHYKTLLKLRAGKEALSIGLYSPVENNNDNVFCFLRSIGSKSVLGAVNLTDQRQKVSMKENVRTGKLIYGSARLDQVIDLKPYDVAAWEIN